MLFLGLNLNFTTITISLALPLALGVGVAKIGDFLPKSDLKHVKNEVKQQKVGITQVQSGTLL